MVGQGRVAVVGAGPAGMAAAMSVTQAGHHVTVFERGDAAEPRGNILNLWPPPIKALGLLGVPTEDIGAPNQSTFSSSKGRKRATIHLTKEQQAEYGGDFIGLLRPDLYERMIDAMPSGVVRANTPVVSIDQDRSGVRVGLADGSVEEFDVLIGADGVGSIVRSALWGQTPPREHNLHIFGGYTLEEVPSAPRGVCAINFSWTVQASWTSIRSKGRDGYEWWVVAAHRAGDPFDGDLHAEATRLAADFIAPVPELIAATPAENMHRWVLRDRKPLPQWSKGRATIIGDAAHPTSPYAGYGAGMSIEDAYFVGRRLAGLDLSDPDVVERALLDFEAPRRPHTARQSQQAYFLSQICHHAPRPLRPVREFIFDHTPVLQKLAADSAPGEILKQLDVMDRTEAEFQQTMSATRNGRGRMSMAEPHLNRAGSTRGGGSRSARRSC